MSSPPSYEEKCLFCKKHGEIDESWVECQQCGWRCHAFCAGVKSTGKVDWVCPLCVPSSVEQLFPEKRTIRSGAVSDSGTVPGSSLSLVLTEKQLAAEQRAQEKAFSKQMELRKKRLTEKLAWTDQKLKAEEEMQELELKAQREIEQKQQANDQKLLERRLAAEREFLKQRADLKKQFEVSKAKMNAFKTEKGKKSKLKRADDFGENSDNDGDDDDSVSIQSDICGSCAGRPKEKKLDGPGCKTRVRITREHMAARNVVSLKLPKFRGEPEIWPLFISSFEHTTAACNFSNLENLTRLIDALDGPALENVRSRLVYPDSVPEIIQDLRDLYGRPEKLMKTLLMKVRNAPAPQADRLSTFIDFGIVVKQLCDHLEAAKMSDHLNNPMLVQELVDKLPPSYKLEWVRFKRGKKNSPLRMFTNFVKRIVADVSEVTDFAELSVVEPSTRKKSVHTRDDELEGENFSLSEIASRRCWMCERSDHLIRNCEDFSRMSLAKREDEVERLNLCTICLGKHGGSRCSLRRRCSVDGCGGEHHPLLHRAEDPVRWKEVQLNTQRDGDRSVQFRMVPVTLYAGSERLDTLAFLDEGSSTTLMEESIANRLRLNGEIEPLVVSWTGNIKRHEENSRKVKFALSAKRWYKRHGLRNVHTVKNLGLPEQNMEFARFAERFPWMADLEVDDYDMQRPTILIGLDNLHLFAPLDSRIGNPGDPIAVQTKLGWTVYGQINSMAGGNAVVNLHSSGRALGTPGRVVRGRQSSSNRCRNNPKRTIPSSSDVMGAQLAGLRWRQTKGQSAEHHSREKQTRNLMHQVRVNVHSTTTVKCSIGKMLKKKETGLTSGVARNQIGSVDRKTVREKTKETVDNTSRSRHIVSSKIWSTFGATDAGVSGTRHEARKEFRWNSKLIERRTTASEGRTVSKEERGRRNEEFLAMVGQFAGQTMPEADGPVRRSGVVGIIQNGRADHDWRMYESSIGFGGIQGRPGASWQC